MRETRDNRLERLREMAESALRNRNVETGRLDKEDITKLIGEIQGYQADLEIRNEELRQSRDRFAKLFNQAPVGFLILDEAGMIIDANQAIAGMLGRDRSDLLRKSFVQFVAAADQSLFLGSFRAFYKRPERKTIEVRLVAKNDPTLFARLEGRLITSETGDQDQFYLAVADISESRIAQAKLKQSEAEYRDLVGTLNDAVVCGDLDGRIHFFNSRAEALFGFSARDAVGSPISRFCPDHRKAEQSAMIRRLLVHGSAHPYETERLTADGRLVPVEVTLSLRTDPDGQPIGFNGVFREITERQRLNESLRQAQRQLRLVLDAVPALIWQKDRTGVYRQVNKAYCRAIGLAENEILGKTDHALYPGEIAAQNIAVDQRVLTSGIPEYGLEERYQRRDGSFGWSRKDKLPYFDENGELVGTIGFSVDITEIKQAERLLRESEFRFRSIVESANDIIYTIRPDGMFTYVSPNWLNFMGEPADIAIGTSFERYVHPEDVHLCRAFLQRVLSTGEKQSSVEYRVKHRDGSWRWHYSNGAPLRDADGNVTGYIGIGRDITERKRAEEALRENELYLRTVLRTTADGFWVVDRQGRIVEVNDAYCAMSGYRREEILGLHITDLDVDESPENVPVRMQRIIANGSEIFETRHRRKDGSCFPLEMSATWLEAKGGRYVCFGRDLTERKRAEATLREERQRLASIIEGTNVGTWEWNIQTGAVVFNDRWAGIIGYGLQEISPLSIDTWIRLTHPEDLKTSQERLERHFAGALPYYECEARMRHKDGHWVWILDRGKVSSWTPEGKPLLMQGTHQDISERKETEAQLLQLRKAESLGRMAGAIAHHYNNLLGAVMGNLDLAMEDLAGSFGPPKELKQAMRAACRAADLSAQMLAYLGQTIVSAAPLDLADVCREALPGIHDRLPPDVKLESSLPEHGPTVRANADQMQQVLGSLLHNAGEAFEGKSGVVSVRLRTVAAAHIPVGHRWPAEFHPEASVYACLEVADSGSGISAESLPKIFDPFYSTKFIGRGLGLSVVLGIVKGWDGCIAVESGPGRGSVFRVFLPVADPDVGRSEALVAGNPNRF